jgi:hypothetical protein
MSGANCPNWSLRWGQVAATVEGTIVGVGPPALQIAGLAPEGLDWSSMSRFRRWLRRSGGRDRAGTATRLDLCPACGEGFVYPVTWAESGPADWWLLLRCGGCGTWRDVVASNHAVAAFDRMLDLEMNAIRTAAERLARESLSKQAEIFGAALRLDLLGADDFR